MCIFGRSVSRAILGGAREHHHLRRLAFHFHFHFHFLKDKAWMLMTSCSILNAQLIGLRLIKGNSITPGIRVQATHACDS